MNIPQNLINTIKKSYQSIRIANIHPTGVLATRALVLTMLVPILLVVLEYVLSFIRGYVSAEANQLIDKGVFIIDHIFVPSVLTAFCGFLALIKIKMAFQINWKKHQKHKRIMIGGIKNESIH